MSVNPSAIGICTPNRKVEVVAEIFQMSYDKKGDVLDVSLGDPAPAIAEEVEDDFFVSRHPVSGEIVGFSILNFEKWFKETREYKTLPLEGQFLASIRAEEG